jgi:hypothetical protein
MTSPLRSSILTLLFLGFAAAAQAQPTIVVTPSSHDFGNLDVGSSTVQTFRIQNQGAATLEGSASMMFGNHYQVLQGASFSAPAGGFADVIVAFAPVRPGTAFDSVVVVHNAGNAPSPLNLPVQGVGVPRPEITVTPLFFDFDTVRTSSDGTIWVKNSGSGQMSVRASISLGAPDFEVVTTDNVFTVSGGDSAEVIVRFSPSELVRKNGELRIDHNGRNRPSPVLIPLTGVGGQSSTFDPFEPNNNAAEASPIQAGFVSDSTEIWPEGDIDYFSFEGIFGEWISITVDILPGSDLDGIADQRHAFGFRHLLHSGGACGQYRRLPERRCCQISGRWPHW